MKKSIFIISILILFHPLSFFGFDHSSRQIFYKESIEWRDNFDGGLPFKGGGSIDEDGFVYRFSLPLPYGVVEESVDVAVDDIFTIDKDLSSLSAAIDIGMLPDKSDVVQKFEVTTVRGEKFLEIEIAPYLLLSDNVKRVLELELIISFAEKGELKSSTPDLYPRESVLSQGYWVKTGVEESGIHKISYSTLRQWGFDTPSRVGVFGYGGQVVPGSNSEYRPKGIPPISVWHSSEESALYFYAHGAVSWEYDEDYKMFIHSKHPYSDKGIYFFTQLSEAPEAVKVKELPNSEANNVSYYFDDLRYHEEDLVNLIKSGRRWFGERFSNSTSLNRDFSFYFNKRDEKKPVKIALAAAGRSSSSNSFSLYGGSGSRNSIMQLIFQGVSIFSTEGYYARYAKETSEALFSGDNITVNMEYNSNGSNSEGWLDYIVLNARSKLSLSDSQLNFRDIATTGEGNITEFFIDSDVANPVVWDVSDITAAAEVITGGGVNDEYITFIDNTDTCNEYVVFDPAGVFPEPSKIEVVSNQNLYGITAVDYIIVSPVEFMEAAYKLAQLHLEHNNLSSVVVTPDEIYNEFSWGHKDVTAIRSFARMLFKRGKNEGGDIPKYMLLLGNGYYTNRGGNYEEVNWIPTYQSKNSLHRSNSYVTDDYFGFLGDNEGDDDMRDRLDIGIGRFPVRTVEEANEAVEKVRYYLEEQDQGSWQNNITFLADDGDNNIHMRDADRLAQKVENNYPQYDLRKIYLDSYEPVVIHTGRRFPGANNDVERAISNGTLLFNFVGHGGTSGLTEEMVVTTNSINQWSNIQRLPLFVTATCEFSRWDDPSGVSAGERVFLNPDGGGIALLTTTRLVYSSLNYNLNNVFFDHVFERDGEGRKLTFGDIIRKTKNGSGSTVNKLNFSLLGDPALQLQYPENSVNTVALNGNPVSSKVDTISALSKVSLEGEVVSAGGERLSNFNGEVELTVYDKSVDIRTLGNQGNPSFNYSEYSNILFNGISTVIDGEFEAEFVVPFDIRYNYDYGKITYYARSDNLMSASGAFTDFMVGGISKNPPIDNKGPEVNLYLNHKNFSSGDRTGQSPLLFAHLFDESGINTSGIGIGHDILLTINGDNNNPIVLNDYFTAAADTYKEGTVVYQLPSLDKGEHTLSLRVWDTHNNSTTEEISFVVEKSKGIDIYDFKWYPNPLKLGENGYFSLLIDDPGSSVTITVEAYSIDGSFLGQQQIRRVVDKNSIGPLSIAPQTLGINSQGIYLIRFKFVNRVGKQGEYIQKVLIK
ncbi:type IX secretion system sortase PorU [Marinilabiliaceae bacterium ANBcel2]|nr:type IX secretion system sortase PorU [Marinilabiliaceae bacterium ANBcel2]